MKTKISAVIFATFALAGCGEQLSAIDSGLGAISEKSTSVDRVTGKRVINLYDRESQIKQADSEAHSLIINLATKKVRLNQSASEKEYARLQKIFNRVHAVSHFRNESWTPILIDAPEQNAFVNGGTHVFVYLGLMKDLKRDDELAAVVAHEIAHIAANHRFEQDSHVKAARLLGSKSARRKHFNNAFTHEQEEEADKIGVLYMALAGYNPHAAPKVWEKFFSQYGDANAISRTHPLNSERLRDTHKIAQQVQQYYSPGVRNSNFAQLLRKNVLWDSEQSATGPAAGKGGGFLLFLESVASGMKQHNAAKKEESRQQQEYQRNSPPHILWTMSDSCKDGRQIEFRFFGYRNGNVETEWPGDRKVYKTKNFNSPVDYKLSCKKSEKICYGGKSVGGKYRWGVGINRRKGCSNCCITCPQHGQYKTATNMTCPKK